MRKSLYVFLCALMGSVLFLILHRLFVFTYLALTSDNFQGILSFDFMVMDYFTLILASIAGLWYGIWVGLYWFEAVYESEEHKGFVDHLICRFWPSPNYNLRTKIDHAAKQIEGDLWQLEELVKKVPASEPEPVKRRVVRRRKTEQ